MPFLTNTETEDFWKVLRAAYTGTMTSRYVDVYRRLVRAGYDR
jgi:hypothetical protein